MGIGFARTGRRSGAGVMHTTQAGAGAAILIQIAVTFLWLGMVLAISFMEAPLKFRAPGVTVPIGLGIGRLVFRALNGVEAALALLLGVIWVLSWPQYNGSFFVMGAVVCLLLQVVAVRPALTRRSDAVLAGEDSPRSRAHHVYVLLELLKVAALASGGVLLLVSLG